MHRLITAARILTAIALGLWFGLSLGAAVNQFLSFLHSL
jgi:hypothetical protein